MRDVLDGLRLAVSLFTVVPVRCERVDRPVARWAMLQAPLAGLIVGLAGAGVLAAARWAGLGSLLAAALAVGAAALLTRGLHLDGLADLADGLGSGKPADEALAVMKKSDIGPFGVITLVLVLIVQVAALARAPATAMIIALPAGRLAVTWACRSGVPCARPGGLGALVAGAVPLRDALAATVIVLALTGTTGVRAPVAVAAGLLVAAAMQHHAVRRLGGITGDVLGALSELSGTAALLVLAAR